MKGRCTVEIVKVEVEVQEAKEIEVEEVEMKEVEEVEEEAAAGESPAARPSRNAGGTSFPERRGGRDGTARARGRRRKRGRKGH